MPKSKSKMMKRLRQQRKDAGLVELDNVWVTPIQRDCLKDLSRQIVDYPNPVLKSPLSVLLGIIPKND